jgi:hypothetical protein
MDVSLSRDSYHNREAIIITGLTKSCNWPLTYNKNFNKLGNWIFVDEQLVEYLIKTHFRQCFLYLWFCFITR